MNIDLLKINSAVPPQQARQASESKPVDTALCFKQQLQRATQDDERKALAIEQAETMLKRAQLQLWQGLFVDDEDSTRGGQPLGSSHWFSQVGHTPVQPQAADTLYRQMQPTLLEKAVPGKSDIDQLIEQVAESVSLAPELIRSVVAAESDFQPQAVSPVGAQGLMQLMPATAAELGVTDSFDPEQNLLGGGRYLKQLLEKYDGDLDKTLAAYNWGQGNVDRKGLAQMPQETRDYLAKVKGLLPQQA